MTLSLLTQDDSGHLWAAVGSDQPDAERLTVQSSTAGTLLVLQGESDLPYRYAMRQCLRRHPEPEAFLYRCVDRTAAHRRQLHLMDRSGASRRFSGAALSNVSNESGDVTPPFSVAANALPPSSSASAAGVFRRCTAEGGAAPLCAHRAVAAALPAHYAVSMHGPQV